MASLKVKVSSIMDTRGLAKLVRLSVEDLYLSSWESRLAEKLAVYGIMALVTDMAAYTKR